MSRAMKASKIPFAPQIPDTWREIPNRFLFLEHSSKVGERWNEYQLLSLTTNGVKEKSINDTGGKIPEGYNNYQTVEKGDMIFCLFDLDCSAVFSGLSTLDGMITSAYDVFRTNEEYLDNIFARFWFDYVFSRRYYKMFSKNIRYTITADVFKSIYTPCPPIAEQKRIGAFLDKKCAEIDEMISLQEKIVEELKAYKQSVITEVVCKGLNPNAPMKDSGVEWIGQIPDMWRITKISRIARTNSGSTPKSITDSEESNITWIRTTDINDCIVSNSSLHLTKEEQMSASCPMLDIGTCVVAMYGGAGTIGKSGILGTCATINQALCSMEVYDSYCSNYLFCVLRAVRSYWMKFAVGTRKDPNINQEVVRNMKIPFPPFNEQQAIAEYLDTKCSEIDTLISLKQSKIDNLKEYKKSIIYEYVTGKKEVTL